MIDQLLQESLFFGVMVSLLAFEAGVWLKKKLKSAFFHPLLFAIAAVIVLLKLFRIDFEIYRAGAESLSYFLTPAAVCLAVPLYEQAGLLKKNFTAILAGIVSGVVTSAGCILLLSVLFHLSHELYVTLLPKSVTTAIGLGITEELGGIAAVTAAVILITGIIGNVCAESVCRMFQIEDPIAKGIAIGSAAHAVGTAKALEIGRIEGAMSSLSIAVTGLVTVLSAPFFAKFL